MNDCKKTKKQLLEELKVITERKQVEGALRKSNQRLDLLAETASRLLMSDSPQKVVDSLCRKVLSFLDCQAFFNYLVDEQAGRLHLNACCGIPQEDAEKMEWLDYGVGLCGCSARDGCRLVVENVQKTQDQYTALVRPFGIQAYACHPLIVQGRVLGTLSFCADNRTHFTDDELSLMKAVADQVAIAMDRKRSEEKLLQANEILEKRVEERTSELAEMVNALKSVIIHREKTEAALRTSEERYALAIYGANDGIWDLDIATGEAYFSPRWKSMLGYKDDEFTNNYYEFEKLIHPDDRNKALDTRKAYLEGFVPTYEMEYRLQHKDGNYRWIHVRGACFRDSTGKPYRFAGSHSDITDRKRIEEALRESEKKYRTLFEESKDIVFIVDTNGQIIDINPAGIELLGYTREEMLAPDFVHHLGISQKNTLQFRKSLRKQAFVKDSEIELKRKDGEKLVFHVSASLMYDDMGRMSGLRGIAHDLTERKKLEQKLLQVQKLESIGILAGGVAHDFNNLLTAIYGYGQVIRDTIPSDDELLQESISQVLRASGRAAELTKNLLAFSRKQFTDPKPVQVHTIIHNSYDLIKKTLGDTIELSTCFSTNNLLVKADTGQIEQVLLNLATNARDAMPSGGHVHIKTREVIIPDGFETKYGLTASGIYALISVSDTGMGIDDKSLARVFEPFYTTKEVGKGTGLGLSIIYGIIKQHKGAVHIESEPVKGTTISIYLPTLETPQARRVKQHGAKHSMKGSETILVTEDDEVVQAFLVKILERVGYKVIIAKDGEDGVLRFKEHADDISLILTDVMMPKKNGKEIIEEIKKINPEMKVIFMSGYTKDIIHQNGILEKDATFITKPFLKADLLQRVREVLDQ
jgi:two-component system, cell cycle sensor histidine kinase and response regulator CckA